MKAILIRLQDELAIKLKHLAQSQSRSVSNYISLLIKKAVKDIEEKKDIEGDKQ